VDLLDGLEDELHEGGRQAHRRLVEQQQAGLRHQRPGHGQHLLLTAGQRARDLLRALLESREHGVPALDALLDDGLVLDREGPHAEVLLDRQPSEHATTLGDLHDAQRDHVMGRHVGQVLSVETDGSLSGDEEAADRVEGGGLACAVGADERDDLALFDRQGDPLERVDVAVVGVEVVHLEQGHVSLPRRRSRPRRPCRGTPR
jgi:hypothetical protein